MITLEVFLTIGALLFVFGILFALSFALPAVRQWIFRFF